MDKQENEVMTMYDENNDYPSTSALTKLGLTALGFLSGGIFLFLLMIFSRKGFGLVLGGVACLVGIVSIMSKNPADRKAGFIIAAAGVLTLLSRITVIAPITGTLMTIGALGLLVLGILNGLKFLVGFSKRP